MKTTTILALSALLLTACAKQSETDNRQRPAVVKVTAAVGAERCGTMQFPCRVKAASELNVAFKVAGTLKRVCVKEGQRVAAGQLLAEMDDTDYRVQLSATEAEYEQVKAEAERVMALYSQGATTASNYDKARYGLQQIEAKLAHHRNQLAYCHIYATEGGTVQSTLFEGGETVAAGMPVVRIIGGQRPEVEITVPANVYTRMDEIVGATATFNALADRDYQLTLLHVLPAANASGMYPVRFAIEGAGTPSPGMNGWVTLTLNPAQSQEAGRAQGIVVPSTALMHDAAGDHIFIVRGRRAHIASVSVTRLTSDGKAIIEGGVAEGDSVVTSGVHSIVDGQEIEALQPASATNIGGLL